MSKILVLGASGMLGHKLFQTAISAGHDVCGTIRTTKSDPRFAKVSILQDDRIREGVDALNFETVEGAVAAFKPDLIVNCMGVVKQRSDANDPVLAISLNSLIPHQLAMLTRGTDSRLVHLSTDCVFSGSKGAYTEEDRSDATDMYGRSKSLGELTSENTVTLRTSMIGRELTGFTGLVEWFLSQEQTVSGFTKAFFSGLTTNELARVILGVGLGEQDLTGVFHLAADRISKRELIGLVADAFGHDIDIRDDDSVRIDRSLDGAKLNRLIGYSAPDWRSMVDEMALDPTPYQEWRQ